MSGVVSRIATIILVALLATRNAGAERLPAEGFRDGRIRAALYDPAEVYRLHGVVGYQIDLQFEPGERFVGLGAGDVEGLAFAAQDNHLFLKPKAVPVTTNVTVLTTRRHYFFEYTAVASGKAGNEVMYAVQFVYPQPPAAGEREQEEEGRMLTETAMNRDYWYAGAPSLRPASAADDGVRLRLRFDGHAELPVIFALNEDGSESLVNFNVEADEIVVHRIARRFVLRRGRLEGCLVNRQGREGES